MQVSFYSMKKKNFFLRNAIRNNTTAQYKLLQLNYSVVFDYFTP
jgi:cytoplasmic iron level regulating protein YaaA (DUF328/UPF0246 family)